MSINSLLKKDYCIPVYGLSVIALAILLVRYFLHLPLSIYYKETAVFFGIFAPCSFDSLGFFLTQQDVDDSDNRIRYRLIQFMQQWILVYPILAIVSTWWITLGCALAWWSGSLDFLFYKLRKEPKQENITWLSWSFLGVVLQLKSVSWNELRISAFIGIAVAVASAFL